MGFVLEIGVEIRKSVTTSMGTCCISLCNHPFLVAFLLFLTFLHRFCPFVFSILVTASPVLVCSVILLGTLLIFGQPNLPETEREKKITHDFSSLRTWVSTLGDDTVILERDGRFSIDKFSGKLRDVADMSLEEVSCSRFSSDYEGSISYVPLIDETFQHTQSDKRELDSKEQENQKITHKDNFWIDSIIRDVEAMDKPASHKGDHSESSMGCGGGDDEASDSGSDRAESLSQDASIEDILPILDELHPLLDLDAPLPAHMSHDDSGVGSDRSNDGSNESDDEDTEIQGGEVEEDEVEDNDCNEEEAQDGKEDESKSAIKWTEDDQMNLRDLGNLELERNQCLENLITRRRASKSFSVAAEKNLIDFDSAENPFNITTISTRHNPFDLSHDPYDDMGLPPIPGSAPSTFLPRRNPFDIPYEPNEEIPELKGDHVEQEFATVSSNTFFCRHESFSLGSSRLGDAKQERQDLNLGPVFVPEHLASEGTSYCSYRRLPSEPSDSKLSSIPESVSSGEDLDEKKFSERDITKEAEVISNIYQASDLIDHRTHSSKDLDYLEMEWPGKKDVQHDELEIKLGEVESGNARWSSTGGCNILGEHITNETHLKTEPFEEKTSNMSSMSSLSDEDEKCSDLRKDRPNFLEPFETEVQTVTGMVDDIQHEEPVYDSSPPGSEKVLSFNSISSDIQAEMSEVVIFPSSVETHVSFVDPLDSDFHGKSIEKGTSGNEEISATSEVHGALENERGSGECYRLFLTSSHTDEHVDLPKNLNVKAASPDSSPQYVYSKDKTPAEQEKNLFLSDISVVDPCFDDHNALPEPPIILSETKEDSSIIKDMNALGAREVEGPSLKNLFPVTAKSSSSKVITSSNIASSVQETISTHTALDQVSEANELPKLSNSKDGSTEVGTNTVGSTKGIALRNIGFGIQETATTVKQVSESDFRELPKVSSSKGELGKVETNDAVGSTTSLQETVPTPLKQVSIGDLNELPKSSYSKNELAKVATNDAIGSTTSLQETVPTPNQVSKGDLNELPKSSNSKDGSNKVETNAVRSAKEIASNTLRTSVPETVCTSTPMKQLAEVNVGDLPKPLNSKDGYKEIETNVVISTKEIASKNTWSDVQEKSTTTQMQVSEGNFSELPKTSNSEYGSLEVGTNNAVGSTNSVQETVTTPLKQVSEGNHSELPKSSNSNGGSTEIGTNAADSTTSVQGTATTPFKQVLEGNVSELPKPSNSKDGSPVVTNVVDSTKSVQDTITIQQVSEANVGELPKPSNSKDGLTEVGTSAVDSTTKLASSNMGTSVQEGITTHIDKQVSEGNLSDGSHLIDGSAEVGTKAVGSTKSVQETVTTLKQVSEGNINELPKPLDLKDGSTEVPNTVSSTKRVQETIQEVSEGNVGDIPKPSKDGSTEVGTTVMESSKKLASSDAKGTSVQDSITSHTEKKAAEGSVGELPKRSNLKDELIKVGVDAVGSTKEIPSSNIESGVQKSITTSSDVAEFPRPSNLEEFHVGDVPKPSISEESSAGELPEPTNRKESSADESQKPPNSKGWLWW